MRALIFQHTKEETPGTLNDWFHGRSFACEVHHWYLNGPSPDPARFGWLIVLGGPMSLDQETELPWLKDEKSFLRNWLTTGKPVLGICLGAQLLAQSLGGRVSPNTQREIGFLPVQRIPTEHPAFRRWPSSLSVYQYHEDAFSLPPGCVSLASSPACPHQAFARGEKILALQFHPESTAEWIRLNGPSITKAVGEKFVQTPAETEELVTHLLPPMTESFHRLLDDFVEGWRLSNR